MLRTLSGWLGCISKKGGTLLQSLEEDTTSSWELLRARGGPHSLLLWSWLWQQGLCSLHYVTADNRMGHLKAWCRCTLMIRWRFWKEMNSARRGLIRWHGCCLESPWHFTRQYCHTQQFGLVFPWKSRVMRSLLRSRRPKWPNFCNWFLMRWQVMSFHRRSCTHWWASACQSLPCCMPGDPPYRDCMLLFMDPTRHWTIVSGPNRSGTPCYGCRRFCGGNLVAFAGFITFKWQSANNLGCFTVWYGCFLDHWWLCQRAFCNYNLWGRWTDPGSEVWDKWCSAALGKSGRPHSNETLGSALESSRVHLCLRGDNMSSLVLFSTSKTQSKQLAIVAREFSDFQARSSATFTWHSQCCCRFSVKEVWRTGQGIQTSSMPAVFKRGETATKTAFLVEVIDRIYHAGYTMGRYRGMESEETSQKWTINRERECVCVRLSCAAWAGRVVILLSFLSFFLSSFLSFFLSLSGLLGWRSCFAIFLALELWLEVCNFTFLLFGFLGSVLPPSFASPWSCLMCISRWPVSCLMACGVSEEFLSHVHVMLTCQLVDCLGGEWRVSSAAISHQQLPGCDTHCYG